MYGKFFLVSLFGTMLLHVSLQICRSCARVVALLAGKRFLASVGEHMPLQVTRVSTLVAAVLTTVRLLTTVGDHVLL